MSKHKRAQRHTRFLPLSDERLEKLLFKHTAYNDTIYKLFPKDHHYPRGYACSSPDRNLATTYCLLELFLQPESRDPMLLVPPERLKTLSPGEKKMVDPASVNWQIKNYHRLDQKKILKRFQELRLKAGLAI